MNKETTLSIQIILNEDFFNDVEIKDEDLTIEEPAKEYNEKTSRELIEHKMSESEMVLMIHINTSCYHIQFNIWHRIERIMKRLKYMLNIYNISISEPFLTYKDDSRKILKDKKFPDDYTIIQHKGCNLYFPECRLREYEPDQIINDVDLELFVFLDKKISVFTIARSAYNFAISLDKCIWKDVTNFNDDCFRWYKLHNINKISNNSEIIESHFDSNRYDGAIFIYKSVLHLVSEELSK